MSDQMPGNRPPPDFAGSVAAPGGGIRWWTSPSTTSAPVSRIWPAYIALAVAAVPTGMKVGDGGPGAV
jgi:hypothetical protein